MFLCPECHCNICTDCIPDHDDNHVSKLLRYELVQWSPKPQGMAPTAQCRHCAKEVKTRWQCKDCDAAICRFCFFDLQWRRPFLAKHEEEHPDHRVFRSVYPPFWVTASIGVHHGGGSCPCADLNPSGLDLHCQRCGGGKSPYPERH